MKKLTSFCLAAFVASVGSGAIAATVTAMTSTLISTDHGSFTIDFTDTNGNNLLDFDEIDAFSRFVSSDTDTMVSVLTVPDISGISVFSCGSLTCGSQSEWWSFLSDTGDRHATRDFVWTYQIQLDAPDPDVAVVPLPATLPLLAGALGLFGIAAWRRKAKS